jgi:hypothetical protein
MRIYLIGNSYVEQRGYLPEILHCYSRLQNRLPLPSKLLEILSRFSTRVLSPTYQIRLSVVCSIMTLYAAGDAKAVLEPPRTAPRPCAAVLTSAFNIPFAGARSKSDPNNAPFGTQQRWRNQPDQVLSWRRHSPVCYSRTRNS